MAFGIVCLAILINIVILVQGNMDIREELNKDIDDILVREKNLGTLHGRVCIVCDVLLKKKESVELGLTAFAKYKELFKGDSVPDKLREEYKFSAPLEPKLTKKLDGCLLSPRSKLVYSQSDKRKRSPKVLLCRECKSGLTKKKLEEKKLPRFAIANGMTIGSAPGCLECLNEVELALLSQARFRGHLFSYWGGCHRSIKGWHSFYDVDAGHTMAVLESVGKLTQRNNIAVVLCGPFTTEQYRILEKKTRVDPHKVLAAFEWLKANNPLYANLEKPEIGQPQIIDTSHRVESSCSDIETKEELTVVFPNGTVTTGGCNDGSEFEEAIAEIRSKTNDLDPILTSQPSQRALRDFTNKTLIKAFPKQFPYGIGSHEELNVQVSQNGYLKHLLSLSLPALHEPCFVLTAHNVFERSRILTGSMWRVTGGKERCDVSEEDLNEAVSRKMKGLPEKKGPGVNFLKSIRTVKRFLGHTNEAAASAQSKFLSLTHHYGCPKALFTVSFDDSLDIRILTMSGKSDVEDWVHSLTEMDPDSLKQEVEGLNEIRMKYPGLCSLNFEFLLDIILDKVVGDNDRKKGIFGVLDAFGVAVEEQGRKTLHAHILVYTKEWNNTLRLLQSNKHADRRKAEKEVQQLVDSIMSTELKPTLDDVDNCDNCKVGKLQFPDNDTMRALRHKHGCQDDGIVFARCENCNVPLTGDDVAKMRSMEREHWSRDPEEIKAILARDVLKATTFAGTEQFQPVAKGKINYRYNHHLSRHTKTCFKRGLECRGHLPDIPENETVVTYGKEPHELFDWTGSKILVDNITVRPKRQPKDAYTNTYCKIISECKAPANSNLSITSGCRSCIYCTCYATKGTQKEDTEEFKKMSAYVGNRFKETRKENTLFEGLSRLMGAVIVGTSEHIVSGPMASYLVRNNGSRFKYSENFQYVPIREMSDFLMNGMDESTVDMSVLTHDDGCFLNNQVLHYIHRPKKLEYVPMLDFFEQYEVRRNGQKNSSIDSGEEYQIDTCEHPGYKKQLIVKRKVKALGQFSHWAFPDAASFGGNIWDFTEKNVSATVEKYCRSALILFEPFRRVEDLTVKGSFLLGFKRRYKRSLPKTRMRDILNNVQLFYNSMRMPGLDDPLCELAKQYQWEESPTQKDEEEEEEIEDNFFDGIFGTVNSAEQENQTEENTEGLSLRELRRKGARGCGFYHLPEHSTNTSVPTDPLREHPTNPSARTNSAPPNPFICMEQAEKRRGTKRKRKSARHRDRATSQQLMQLVYTDRLRVVEENTADFIGPRRPVVADGTVHSIVKWSQQKHLKMDREQRTAFQIIASTFVLSYYDDASTNLSDNTTGRSQVRQDYTSEKQKLRRLARKKDNKPLRMFLDGAGGAGKSHVVKEVLKYAEQFTTNLNFTFDSRTIVVTALSGVAAVSIKGETIHSAASLNSKVMEDDNTWCNARLLIIDEVSFMSAKEVDTLDKKLRELKRSHADLFGGMNILFCGDFRQLEPCRGSPLYSQNDNDKKWSNSLNCYLELKGMFRFEQDPEWGRILARIRTDTHTSKDIDEINKRTLRNLGSLPPHGSSYCVYMNADRSAIDTGIFAERLKQDSGNPLQVEKLVIRASNMKRTPKGKPPVEMQEEDKRYIYQNCGDNCLKTSSHQAGGHFVDPLLKLYKHIPLMLLSNTDVKNGHANGTRVILQSVVLYDNCRVETISIDGKQCPSVEASSVKHLVCTMEDDDQKIFHIQPRALSCRVKAPLPKELGGNSKVTINFSISLFQVPLIANNATTGHKLQGQTKQNLVISVWSKRKNWNYVALSRVRTREGLYLVQPLSHFEDFSVSHELRAMLEELRDLQPVEANFDMDKEEELWVNRAKTYAAAHSNRN